MTMLKLVIPLMLALAVAACASNPETVAEQGACSEQQRATGSLIAKRETCADRSPEAVAAAQERAQAMRDQQIREVVQSKGPGG